VPTAVNRKNFQNAVTFMILTANLRGFFSDSSAIFSATKKYIVSHFIFINGIIQNP